MLRIAMISTPFSQTTLSAMAASKTTETSRPSNSGRQSNLFW